jgi:hypothetical protein
MKKTSRRDLLAALGLGGGLGLMAGYPIVASASKESTPPAADPWRYVAIDPKVVADEAYRFYPEGRCMYGAFRAILATWSKASATSLDAFPFHMFGYGHGGAGGWGALCGSANAGAAAIGLFVRDNQRRDELIGELFAWYERTRLPRYRPADQPSPHAACTMADSVLCHVSVAHWCEASGAGPTSKERKHRCRCLTADVAAKTVDLLNGNLTARTGLVSIETAAKQSHEPPRVAGKMQCATCHQDGAKHGLKAE